MYDFILQLSLIFGLAVIVFLMARALPRVSGSRPQASFVEYFEYWLERLPLHTVDNKLNKFIFRFLRKSRIIVMKLDNILLGYLSKAKNGNGQQQSLIDHLNEDKK